MVLYLKFVADTLMIRKLRQVQPEVPLLTFQRICFAYINNDWFMVISSSFTLLTTVVMYSLSGPLTLVRSES